MQTKDLLTSKRLRHLDPMVTEITVDELQRKREDGEIFKLIEVSDAEDYDAGHIAGATHISISELQDKSPQLFKKFQQIILYAQESSSSVGFIGARILQRLGFSNVQLLKVGKEGWKGVGLPLEGATNTAQS